MGRAGWCNHVGIGPSKSSTIPWPRCNQMYTIIQRVFKKLFCRKGLTRSAKTHHDKGNMRHWPHISFTSISGDIFHIQVRPDDTLDSFKSKIKELASHLALRSSQGL